MDIWLVRRWGDLIETLLRSKTRKKRTFWKKCTTYKHHIEGTKNKGVGGDTSQDRKKPL